MCVFAQLGVESEEQRLAAVELLGAILSSPGFSLETSNPQLFAAFLRRFNDKQVLCCKSLNHSLMHCCHLFLALSLEATIVMGSIDLAATGPCAAGSRQACRWHAAGCGSALCREGAYLTCM